MLAFGNKEFRNLQEQVLKNMDDIKSIKEGSYVLDEFGIKVIGQVATSDDLPSGQDFEYGDAFAVGTETPYELWIWTRTDEQGLIGYWLDIGAFPVPGPQGETGETGATGPQGPQGEKGDKGDKGDTGEQGPQGAKGDKGDTGATGAQGPKGDTGTTYTILGQVDDESDLPDPSLVDRHGAYLVGTTEPYELYVVSGESNDLEWLDAGVIAIGPQGPQGPQGPKGDTGATGAQGPQGATGAQGPKGDTGDPVTITVNGTTYTQSSGNITLPNYPNGGVWGNITGTLADQTDLKNALDAKQDTIDSSHKLSASLVSGLATVATSGDYDDLSDKPDLTVYAQSANLATVATTGDYDDLLDKPTIPSATSQLTNDSGFITNAALSGYALSSEIPTAVSELTNDSDYATETYVDTAIAGIGDVFTIKGSVATVADLPASGNAIGDVYYVASEQAGFVWIEINNVEQWEELGPSIDLSAYAETADLASVAFSGSYNDLSNKPTIPAAQVNSDWNAASGVAQILNKPNLATVATTGSYSDLSNKPTIPTNTDYVDRTTNQTIGGTKTFDNTVYIDDNEDKATLNPGFIKLQYENDSPTPDHHTIYHGNGYIEHGAGWDSQSQDYTNYTLTFPNATGTLALTSDFTNYVTTNTTQTITAQKTIDGLYSDDGDTPFTPLKLKYDSNEVNFLEVYDYENNCTVAFDTLATTTRKYTFPNANGTIALTSQIPDTSHLVNTDTYQIIGGQKSFYYFTGANDDVRAYLETGSYASNTGATQQILSLSYTDSNNDTIETKILNWNRPNRDQYYLDLSWSKNFDSGDFLMNDIMIDSTGITLSKYSYDATTDEEVEDAVTLDDLISTVNAIPTKLDATACTYQTTAPTAAATDGGVHIVYLSAEPSTKYAGYIYMIAEN